MREVGDGEVEGRSRRLQNGRSLVGKDTKEKGEIILKNCLLLSLCVDGEKSQNPEERLILLL